jgi:hypothetical protein
LSDWGGTLASSVAFTEIRHVLAGSESSTVLLQAMVMILGIYVQEEARYSPSLHQEAHAALRALQQAARHVVEGHGRDTGGSTYTKKLPAVFHCRSHTGDPPPVFVTVFVKTCSYYPIILRYLGACGVVPCNLLTVFRYERRFPLPYLLYLCPVRLRFGKPCWAEKKENVARINFWFTSRPRHYTAPGQDYFDGILS